MLIGNLPEDTTPSSQGYVVYSEDGVHLSKMSRDNFIRGVGKGTGMMYWDEGDGETVMEGTKIIYPRQVEGSLYSYGQDDGNAYWTALYPPTYWGAFYTGAEERNIIEICKDVGNGKEEIFAVSNRGAVRLNSFSLDTVNANYYYYIKNNDRIALDDYFMKKYLVGRGLEEYFDSTEQKWVLRATGILSLVGGTYVSNVNEDQELILNTYGGLDFVNNGVVNGLGLIGMLAEYGSFMPGVVAPIHKSLFARTSTMYANNFQPLSTAYGMETANTVGFNPDQLFYYDGSTDAVTGTEMDSTLVYRSHKNIDINSMYGLNLSDGPVYLVGQFHSDGFFYLEPTFIAQSIPATQSGVVYIYLGDSKSGILDLLADRPKYWYLDGAVRPYYYVPSITSPINDVKAKSNGSSTAESVIGSNGETGIAAGSGINITVNTYNGTKTAEISVDPNSITPQLSTVSVSGTNTASTLGKNNIFTAQYGYHTFNDGDTVYINLTASIKRTDGYALTTGNKYKVYFTLSNDSSLDPVPYDNNQGGYFIDVKEAKSGDTELILNLSGLWNSQNYTQSSNITPALILVLESSENITCKYVWNSIRVAKASS